MRVLVAGTYGERNGIETYTRHLAGALQAGGHEVVVADRSGLVPGADEASPPSIALPARSWAVWRAMGPFEAARASRGIRAAIESRKPDLVHCTYPELMPRTDVPTVVTAWHPDTAILHRARTSRQRGERPFLGALFAASDRVARRRADVIVATSPMVARALGGPPRATWIPPFVPDAVVREPQQVRSQDCLMVAGQLDDPRKGLGFAVTTVAAMRRHDPAVRLVLIGGWIDDAARAALPDFCDARGLLPSEQVAATMREAGCLLMTSVFEEFGYVALEALAAGTPVASAPMPGFEGIVSDGLLVADRRDPEELADRAAAAIRLEGFSFPDACRASVALGSLERLYDSVIR
jgi:glycosyltransferase involved in cell wall biosynthesis